MEGCESVLSDWFGAPVILTASGRSGLALYLSVRGFHRYRQRVWVPPFLSRCIMNAVTNAAFPVEEPQAADGELLYHQFGYPQRRRPRTSAVIEDVAHAFFASPDTGARDWMGDVAVFSLPKFFSVGGMAGGLVVVRPDLEEPLRSALAGFPAAPSGVRSWMRQVVRSVHSSDDGPGSRFLGSAYELLFEFPQPDPDDLAGFPTDLEELRRIGRERLRRIAHFRSVFGEAAWPGGFVGAEEAMLLPFAIPYFGDGDVPQLAGIGDALRREGFEAGIYHVDVNRDMTAPDYRPCLLLPCHDLIPEGDFARMCEIVRGEG